MSIEVAMPIALSFVRGHRMRNWITAMPQIAGADRYAEIAFLPGKLADYRIVLEVGAAHWNYRGAIGESRRPSRAWSQFRSASAKRIVSMAVEEAGSMRRNEYGSGRTVDRHAAPAKSARRLFARR
ncbi:hypothetical protein [Lysobacter sp. 1R34A]|uniref:hypothetical protein n=1 Tax=Lysobacter sp. 1R34A TaxID=3445786 RepID=UPI003EEABB3F